MVLSLVSEMLKAIAEYAKHDRAEFVRVALSYYGQASSTFRRAQRIETKLSHDVLNPARVPL